MSYRVPFDVPELSYSEALAALREIVKVGISPMLETVEDMLSELGDPDLCFDSVQVVGTNGKTSTSRYTAAILAGEGYKTALYTSPELVHYTERMEIAGSPVSEEQFAHGISCALEAGRRVNAARDAAGERPYDITEFDLLTVGACVVFAEAGVDVAVLECGMGGRWDATSAAKSIRGVAITGVGLDHMHILGDTLEAIAAEKAATIKPGRFCVLGSGIASPQSAEEVFLARCAEFDVEPLLVRPFYERDYPTPLTGHVAEHPELPCAYYEITREPSGLDTPLELRVQTPHASYEGLTCIKPAYQAANISCAVALAESFIATQAVRAGDLDEVLEGQEEVQKEPQAKTEVEAQEAANGEVMPSSPSLDLAKLVDSIRNCPTPGRFDVIREKPLALIDAAHNPQSIEAFLDAIRDFEADPARRPLLLAAVLADKDVPGIVELLAPEFPQVITCATSSPRALPSSDLADIFTKAGNAPLHVCETVAAALSLLKDTPFIACGSITLAGEVAGLMRG